MLDIAKVEQITSFRTCFMEHPEITEIYSIFDRLMRQQRLGGAQDFFLLTANAGVGKKALISNYVKRFRIKEGIHAEMPVLSTKIPIKATEIKTLERLLTDLNSAVSDRVKKRNASTLEKRVLKVLREKKVRLVIVNQIEEILQFKDIDQRLNIIETLFSLSRDAQIPFVFVGQPHSSVLFKEEQYEYLRKKELSCFTLFDQIEKKENGEVKLNYVESFGKKKYFADIVAGFAKRMGFIEKPQITGDDTLFPLFAICRGEMRILKNFLNNVLEDALEQNEETISFDRLSKTFETLYPSQENPFKVPLMELKVQQIEKGTRYNLNASIKEDKLLPIELTKFMPINQLLSKKPTKV